MKKVKIMIAAVLFSVAVVIPSFAGQENLTPEEIIYQPALNHYIEARSLSLSGANRYAIEKSFDVDYRWLTFLPSGADVEYAFYDIDQNGIPELFIQNSSDFFDCFGYDGNKAVRLMDLSGMGNRGKLTLYQNGIIETLSYGGQASV